MSNPIFIINKLNENLLFGNGKNDNKFIHYIFKIILFMKNGEHIIIEETSTEKYINLFSYNNKINFNDIKFYELNIDFISFDVNKYSIKNSINTCENYTFKDDIIYLEINKNNDNYANCCIYIKNNTSRLFFTPPNY
jgi:hypothetical protein